MTCSMSVCRQAHKIFQPLTSLLVLFSSSSSSTSSFSPYPPQLAHVSAVDVPPQRSRTIIIETTTMLTKSKRAAALGRRYEVRYSCIHVLSDTHTSSTRVTDLQGVSLVVIFRRGIRWLVCELPPNRQRSP